MFYCFVLGIPVADRVNTLGGAKILRKEEVMFRLIFLLLFSSLDKKVGCGRLCSNNVTCIFLG